MPLAVSSSAYANCSRTRTDSVATISARRPVSSTSTTGLSTSPQRTKTGYRRFEHDAAVLRHSEDLTRVQEDRVDSDAGNIIAILRWSLDPIDHDEEPARRHGIARRVRVVAHRYPHLQGSALSMIDMGRMRTLVPIGPGFDQAPATGTG